MRPAVNPWKCNPHRPGWHGGIHALVFQDVFRKWSKNCFFFSIAISGDQQSSWRRAKKVTWQVSTQSKNWLHHVFFPLGCPIKKQSVHLPLGLWLLRHCPMPPTVHCARDFTCSMACCSCTSLMAYCHQDEICQAPSEFTVLTILVVLCPLITAAIFPLRRANYFLLSWGFVIIQQWLRLGRLSRFGCDVMCS